MSITDIYLLQRSEQFILGPRQEITVDLTLKKAPKEPCTVLTGSVTGKRGPIAGATVKVFDKCYKPVAHTVTDLKGKFVFSNIFPPGEYNVIATAKGYKVSGVYSVMLEPKNPVSIKICLEVSDLKNLATVYGVVYNEANIGLADAKVVITNYNKPKKQEAITQSNADGEFLVYGLKPQKYWISASKEGYFLPQKIAFELMPDEITCVNLFIYPDGSSLDGTVSGMIDFDRKSVHKAVAALYKVEENGHILVATKETNEDGFYLFTDVEPGEYLVKAKKEER